MSTILEVRMVYTDIGLEEMAYVIYRNIDF